MARVSFDSTKRPLEELLKQAHSGALQLPDFQRSWVWKDEGLRALLASVSRSFPIGTLMTLQTGGEVDFKPRLIEGAPEGNKAVRPDALVLDGQQRITSLYQLTMRQEVVETRGASKQPLRRWYYIDMRAALDATLQREPIIAVDENRLTYKGFRPDLDFSTSEKEFGNCVFPTNKVFASDQWQQAFFAHWNNDGQKIKLWFDFANEVLAAFRQYQVPVIALDKTTSREAVCLVFEKVNTGGEKLDAFELLTAIYAASNFDLQSDWRGGSAPNEGRARQLAHAIHFPNNILTQLQPTDFLQAVSLLDTLERRRAAGPTSDVPVTGTREALLRINVEDYKRLAPRVQAGFVAAGRLLFGQKVFAVRDLPYQSQLIPMSVIMADLGEHALTADARSKLVRWWWCGVFGELYGSATDSRFAKDVQEVGAWIDGGEEPSTVKEAIFRADRLQRMTIRISAAYKGVNVLLMQIGARDFRTGQEFEQTAYYGESVDIHHIFPRKWCAENAVATSEIDPIINKTPLFYKSNRIIGGIAPSLYLKRLEKEVGGVEGMNAVLRSHLIEPDHLRSDDFAAFYVARREALLAAIAKVMGKGAYRTASSELSGSAFDPGENEGQEDEFAEGEVATA